MLQLTVVVGVTIVMLHSLVLAGKKRAPNFCVYVVATYRDLVHVF